MAEGKLTRAEALMIAGYRLRQKYGLKPIPRDELIQQAVTLGPWESASIIPSDFCYDRANRDPTSFRQPMFVLLEGGYLFLGPNYPYSGPVRWHSKDGDYSEIGFWLNGELTLGPGKDPRGKA